jgi:hypothetical protein
MANQKLPTPITINDLTSINLICAPIHDVDIHRLSMDNTKIQRS